MDNKQSGKKKWFVQENEHLVKEWNPTKNGNLKPSDVMCGSDKQIWWICEKGHEYMSSPHNRSNGRGCPVCSGKLVIEGFNDLKTLYPDIAKEWHPTLNGDLKPTDITSKSSHRIWWKDANGHEWQATVANRSNGQRCPYCTSKKVLPGFNDLATSHPELSKEWEPNKNAPLMPMDVSKGSNRKIWWKCSNGHEWMATVLSRTHGAGCPICCRRKDDKNETTEKD